MKLTPRQLMVLSIAAAREDGLAPIPDKIPKAALSKLAATLVSLKLMRELLAKCDMPVWYKNESDRPISLIITKAGRAVLEQDRTIGLEGASPEKPVSTSSHQDHSDFIADDKQGRRVNKRQLVLQMLSHHHGVTMEALRSSTGWLPHTIRAMLSRLRKQGLEIERRGLKGTHNATYHLRAAFTGPAKV